MAPSVISVSSLLLINVIRSVLCSNETVHSTTTETVPGSKNSSDSDEHPVFSSNTSSLLQSLDSEEDEDDTGKLAGIIIGSLMGGLVILAIVLVVAYRHFFRKSRTSLNFDNPVYRKTTEDQFSLEKNQYHPAHSYPSSLEPLTSPGTNEFV